MVSVVGYMFGVFVCSFSDDMNVIKCLSFWVFYMMFKISFTNKWLTTFLYCFLSLQVSPVFPVLVVSKNKNKKSQTKSRLAWLCCSAPQIYFPSVHFWCKRVFPLWIELLCLFSAQIWWEHRWNSYLYRTPPWIWQCYSFSDCFWWRLPLQRCNYLHNCNSFSKNMNSPIYPYLVTSKQIQLSPEDCIWISPIIWESREWMPINALGIFVSPKKLLWN